MQGYSAKLGAILALGVLCGGCASMGPEIEDWPQLVVHEHYVARPVLLERCKKYAAFGSPPVACAEVNFAAGRCDIWLSAGAAPAAQVLKHERLHCAGHDHEGESTLREALAGWRSRPSLVAQGGEKQN
jgi:hypothetical protein